jgi:hypothetical protein
MKSPFPGMDPYLERHWEDVHTRLITYVADALQVQLADDLVARAEEKVFVEAEGEQGWRKPDVRIVERPPTGASGPETGGVAVVDEPLEIEVVGDPNVDRSVLIYDSAGERLITAIEILSPWNKTPDVAKGKYLKKRSQYLRSNINLVEIDLIRTGDWLDMIGDAYLPQRALTPYRVSVVDINRDKHLLYPIELRSRLPRIKVPLRAHDPVAVLDLQELLDHAYKMGRYNGIDYRKPCRPPLTGDDAAWAEQLLHEAGKR